MIITLENMEKEYRKTIDGKDVLNVDEFINLAINLFKEIKIEGITESNSYEDMLLFQYGVYDWGDENGKHFSFDITRQICLPDEDEPYQLNFTLIFQPSAFLKLDSYNIWSDEFDNIDAFSDCIKATSGYEIACRETHGKIKLIFGQC